MENLIRSKLAHTHTSFPFLLQGYHEYSGTPVEKHLDRSQALKTASSYVLLAFVGSYFVERVLDVRASSLTVAWQLILRSSEKTSISAATCVTSKFELEVGFMAHFNTVASFQGSH